MTLFETFGLLAGLVQLIGYIWYVSHVVRGNIQPSTGSWIIWSYGNAIVCWNYIALGNEITLKEFLPLVCGIASLITAIIFLLLKKFRRPKRYEWGILIADVIITVYWIVTGEHLITNILLQCSVILSFIPAIVETKQEPHSERKGPWLLWSLAYALLFVAESGDSFWEYIYPINYFIWHLVMALVAARSKPTYAP